MCENFSFRAKKASFAGSFALLLVGYMDSTADFFTEGVANRLLVEVYAEAALSETMCHY